MAIDLFAKMAEQIIKEQENIIGPIAIEQANKVNGLNVNWSSHQISLEGNKTEILEKLVEQYQALFGQASVEVCREAISRYISQIPKDQIPTVLR